jgi:hypothetical protein
VVHNPTGSSVRLRSVRLSRPGGYDFRAVRLAYTTGGHSGWQFAYLGVHMTAVRPPSDLPPPSCPA